MVDCLESMLGKYCVVCMTMKHTLTGGLDVERRKHVVEKLGNHKPCPIDVDSRSMVWMDMGSIILMMGMLTAGYHVILTWAPVMDTCGLG
ncbi:uncharacterized protein BO88DRAFT_407716 [Aspergillus vadensis CBS 113365]|uniref:Uncharacterized protein n=1 Tax=Aspergillus vadensis (strain CBS 113365 / IMI 142717 / IBT 24658) TaxID=1448311 RepID=A0A319BQN0_ASPVC|nr:hypothetical protein BO88DRAFT_407716 [Aspergillus vadensis CBS 113365]PYH65518.1 hypothetical protein BO88DRAFT_407716 [Aspergillus vadensis CBS 113365]